MLNKAAKTRQFWLQKEEWKNTNTLTNQENRVGPNGEEKRKNRIRKIVIIDAIFAVIVVGFFSELQNRNWLLPTSGSWSDARPTSAVKSKLKNQTKVHRPQRERRTIEIEDYLLVASTFAELRSTKIDFFWRTTTKILSIFFSKYLFFGFVE